jgi:uncharacterized OsmC-like protein
VKITLLTDESLRLEPTSGLLTVEAPSLEHSYSPFHMLASGLAVCTFSILQSWAANLELGVDDLAIDVAWTFAEKPHRIGTIDLGFTWPSLPANRVDVAKRVATLCPIHATLHHPPAVTIVHRA